jgi:hypothetical protein
MRTSNRLFLSAGLFVALLSPACGDSSGTDDDESSVRVTLSGDQTGQFIISGATDDDPFALVGSGRSVLGHYLIEADGSTPETVELVAMRHTSDGNVDLLILWGPSQTGTQAITEDFTAIIVFGLPIDNSGELNWDAFESAYTLDAGTIKVQQVGENRYQGTFSGTGWEWRNGAPITMTSGTFDIRGESSPGLSGSLCQLSGRC